ncbi:MAG: hypothetical protein ACP5D7_24030, partial [Limnospira sp.]
FPSPCGELIGNDPMPLETVRYAVFKVRLREGTEKLLNKTLQALLSRVNFSVFHEIMVSALARDCQPPKTQISLFLAEFYINFQLSPRRAELLKNAI